MSGRVLSCEGCSAVTHDAYAKDWDRCGSCGGDETRAGTETPCPEPDKESCGSDDHHWGTGTHVADDDR